MKSYYYCLNWLFGSTLLTIYLFPNHPNTKTMHSVIGTTKRLSNLIKRRFLNGHFYNFLVNQKMHFLYSKADPDKVFDIMADTAVIPMPIWCREPQHSSNATRAKWQFCGHSGVYATLMRDFHYIWEIITSRLTMFDHLYIIGHSLGGGLAILFGLESIINKYLPSNKSMHIVTFGTPAVISYECRFESLSLNAQRTLFQLHNICHCFVNRFDPIPRVPARIEWMMTVIPYALKKIIADQVKKKMNLPSFLVPLVKSGVKSGVSKFVQYVENYLDLLRSYHPFGTYYFFAGKDCDDPFITKNQLVIEELLGFIPPHKIVTSDNQEVRVRHFSTKNVKAPGIHHRSRFSLQNITEIMTELTVNKEETKDEEQSNEDDTKMDIMTLLREKSKKNGADEEGVLYDNSSLYVAVESVESDEYKTKKLSEQGWVMLVSNHLMEQYIDIFKAKVQCNKSQYPMLPPKNVEQCNHFGVRDVNAYPMPVLQQQYYPTQYAHVANSQQIGNTQYRITHQPTHYVVYPQRQQPPLNSSDSNNVCPSLRKR
eukprot:630754_1